MRNAPASSYMMLYRLARTLQQQPFNIRETMTTALQQAIDMVAAAQGHIVLLRDDMTLADRFTVGVEAEAGGDAALWSRLSTRGLVGFVYYTQRTVTVRDLSNDARWPALPDGNDLPRSGSAVGLPLRHGGQTRGVMLVLHPEVAYFDESHVELLEEIAALTGDALSTALDHHESSEQKRDYLTLINQSVVPILLTDRSGIIQYVNQQATELLGYVPNEVVGKPITQLHSINLGQISDGNGLEGLGVNEECTVRASVGTRSGGEIPAIIRLRRLRVDNHDIIEWVEQDISAQMELEQLRRDLTAMVYHDLRGPLQTIRGSIYKLAQILANHPDPNVLTLLQVGIRGTRQLRRMVDSLLDVQRLEDGRAVLHLSAVDPRVLLADAAQLVQPLALEAGQAFHFEVDETLPTVEMDNDMIMRVVTNLLENAVKYTPTNGKITLRATQNQNTVLISVRDSGPGIPESMRHTIFDKFNRVRYKDAPKGIGLGLAFCRLAVKAHAGDIWVESEEGSGSEFIFALPITSPLSADESGAVGKTVRVSQLATTA